MLIVTTKFNLLNALAGFIDGSTVATRMLEPFLLYGPKFVFLILCKLLESDLFKLGRIELNTRLFFRNIRVS